MFNDDSTSDNVFSVVNIDFAPTVEIQKIWPTSVKEYLQIIAKDSTESMIYIVTWDFENNTEEMIFHDKAFNS